MTCTVYLEVAKRPTDRASMWTHGGPKRDIEHPWRATSIYPSAAMKPGWVWDRLYIAMPEATAQDYLRTRKPVDEHWMEEARP